MSKHFGKRIKYLLIGIFGFLLFVLAWSLIEPYTLSRETVDVEIPSLPSEWQGQQVAVISDFQLGMWMDNVGTVEKAIDQIVDDRPAIALIGGDFVYKQKGELAPELDQIADLVRPLTEAQIPTYAVLGNHDYGAKKLEEMGIDAQQRADKVQQALEDAGVRVLRNEVIALSADPSSEGSEAIAPLYLVGIDAYLPQQSEPLEVISQVPDQAARLVLMHNPASFLELPPSTAPVAVAGHTHGGQIRLPFLPEWSWMSLVEDKSGWSWISEIEGDTVKIAGWIPGYGNPGNQLYINRGIGFSHLPIRFHCRPELTIFTLQAEAA